MHTSVERMGELAGQDDVANTEEEEASAAEAESLAVEAGAGAAEAEATETPVGPAAHELDPARPKA